MSKCKKCNGHLENVQREGKTLFHFCRACKIPYNELGRVIIDTRFLGSAFNPVKSARAVTGKSMPGASEIAKTSMEAVLIDAFLAIYSAGMKDGILLAYSQDVGESKPVVPSKE